MGSAWNETGSSVQTPGPSCLVSCEKTAKSWGTSRKYLPAAVAAAHVGNGTPLTGGSEVLQADEYIKGLLLWTVQSFSCCLNAACPIFLLSVPSVEQAPRWILRPWMAQRPHWKYYNYTRSRTMWNERWTSIMYLNTCSITVINKTVLWQRKGVIFISDTILFSRLKVSQFNQITKKYTFPHHTPSQCR